LRLLHKAEAIRESVMKALQSADTAADTQMMERPALLH
jgi:hypothetical protein